MNIALLHIIATMAITVYNVLLSITDNCGGEVVRSFIQLSMKISVSVFASFVEKTWRNHLWEHLQGCLSKVSTQWMSFEKNTKITISALRCEWQHLDLIPCGFLRNLGIVWKADRITENTVLFKVEQNQLDIRYKHIIIKQRGLNII